MSDKGELVRVYQQDNSELQARLAWAETLLMRLAVDDPTYTVTNTTYCFFCDCYPDKHAGNCPWVQAWEFLTEKK